MKANAKQVVMCSCLGCLGLYAPARVYVRRYNDSYPQRLLNLSL